MLADLDLLLITVFCAADDLLPDKPKNAKRIVTDAEVVTLCVAQSIMGISSDPRFIAVARKRLGHLFSQLPDREGFYKRREALSDVIEALIFEFARHSPGSADHVLLIDSTPIECARSRETVKRGGQSSLDDALSNAADYGYCASHSRFFYGFRLHTLFALDGTPRAIALTSPKIDEKDVCLQLVARCRRQPGQFLTLIGDKNFRGKQFEADLAALDATLQRPHRKDEPGNGPHLARIRQRVESIYWTAKDVLTLERHAARTLHGLRTRLACRFLALAAAIALNHRLGLPSAARRASSVRVRPDVLVRAARLHASIGRFARPRAGVLRARGPHRGRPVPRRLRAPRHARRRPRGQHEPAPADLPPPDR